MESFFNVDKLMLFILFFIPGFISLKIWDIIVPGDRRDFTKSFFEVLAYSALNYAAFSWLIILIHSNNFPNQHFYWYIFFSVLLLFLIPVLWPIIFFNLLRIKLIAKYIISPFQKPWDYVFSKRESCWIIVHLKDERRIGGKYDTKSFSSSAPAEEQIYLEEVWTLDDNGNFLEQVQRSKGIIIMREDITAIEFFK